MAERRGVVVIEIPDVGDQGYGFDEVLRAIRDVVPPGATAYGAIQDDADRVMAVFDLPPVPVGSPGKEGK